MATLGQMISRLSDTFSIFPFYKADLHDDKIDSRMIPYLHNWKVIEIYKNKTVTIPNDWNSTCDVVKYFQVVKRDNDPNAGEEENEIGATIWLGWRGYDHEVEINLFIRGKDVLSHTRHVSAEILKAGGASMQVYHKSRLITDFMESDWWGKKKQDKVWIDKL